MRWYFHDTIQNLPKMDIVITLKTLIISLDCFTILLKVIIPEYRIKYIWKYSSELKLINANSHCIINNLIDKEDLLFNIKKSDYLKQDEFIVLNEQLPKNTKNSKSPKI